MSANGVVSVVRCVVAGRHRRDADGLRLPMSVFAQSTGLSESKFNGDKGASRMFSARGRRTTE